ncbi:hypothetical protein MTAT_12190 [Moorella thermoacetica]|uniref:Methylcobalamin:coenzyme M methyltransferase n=1 Tax=Neomoorella thermoacetica TaxID=1525 RepID=A0AAC9HGP1_NEOTH|nr:methylcobalamin:coenzyme M methyltransferase [Moorella thermoacetica]TYL13821.1 hypothetical protein MTAT_12190 [Moorella thermoacetica]
MLKALNHQEPDRIPFDLGSTLVTGISSRAYKAYLEYLGKPAEKIEIVDMVQQLASVPEEMLRELEVDIRGLWPGPPSNWKLEIEEDENYRWFKDEWGIIWKMPKVAGFYFDMQFHPLAEIDSIEGLRKHKWPNPTDPARFVGLREKAEAAYNAGYAVVMGNMTGGFAEIPAWLRGFENWYCDLALNPQFAHELLDITLDIQMRYVEKILEVIGDLLTVYIDSEDAGSQKGPLMSRKMFQEFVKPRLKQLYEMVKKRSRAKIFVHSCGSVYELIPDFIEAGVDILNPVQISAKHMDPVRLKREFGKDLTFWGGGVDTQYILPRGTPAEVRDCVRRQIEILAPGGGFVFNTVHNIQADVPPQNLEAMLLTLKEYGKY